MKRLSAAGGKIMGKRRKQDDPDYVDPKNQTAGARIPKKISPFGPVSGLGRRSSVLYEAVCPGCYLSAVLLDRNSVCNDTD